ncbi:hypothetical protein GGI20_004377 [Coemansia sp. BCRC 34301]|nr:hypothetical protein GGI20_004377 [Coemansia sp. BCRC 34301]
MSDLVSPAQALPIEVVRQIIGHFVLELDTPIDRVSDLEHGLKELLSVCSTWRQAATERLWERIELTISSDSVVLNCPSWVEDNKLPHDVAPMVKEVHVIVPIALVSSGAASEALAGYMGDMAKVENARKLVVTVNGHLEGVRLEARKNLATAYAKELAGQLKLVAPSLDQTTTLVV